MAAHYGWERKVAWHIMGLLPFFLPSCSRHPHNFCCLGDISYCDIWINPSLPHQLSLSSHSSSPLHSAPLVCSYLRPARGWFRVTGRLEISTRLPPRATHVTCGHSGKLQTEGRGLEHLALIRQSGSCPAVYTECYPFWTKTLYERSHRGREPILQMPGSVECVTFW